jgi:tetratricopeptide (TPR) repeat protein
MMTQSEDGAGKPFVRSILPWIVAGVALVLYLLTLNHWVTFGSLLQVARASGWTWQPELYGPLYWLVTLPIHWLPKTLIPIALNLFCAVCGALTLGLLARSVALLPHDRTHPQRQKETSDDSLLTLGSAWLPPVLATIVCGLQLTFWENATSASTTLTDFLPPLGAGCDILDVLVFAYVIRCLLEYRMDGRDTWMLRAAFIYGLGITNNWAMIGFFPAYLMALVWIKGLSFFNVRFLGQILGLGLAGLLLYLLLPLRQSMSDISQVSFWLALKANIATQKNIVGNLYQNGRNILMLLGLTSVVPVFIIAIRWPAYFGDTSKLGVAVATFTFHVVHALFLIACVWVAMDPPLSPRNKGFPLPFLTFYYLGALSVGYFSGYLLLVFSSRSDRPKRVPAFLKLINQSVTGLTFLLLPLAAGLLVVRNYPQIRITNGPQLQKFASQIAENLPPSGGVLMSDDPRRLLIMQSFLTQKGRDKDFIFLDTSSFQIAEYHYYLKKHYGSRWPMGMPPNRKIGVYNVSLVDAVLSLYGSTTNIFYLHPSLGYYFEFLYLEPSGLAYKLSPLSTNDFLPPLLSPALLNQNQEFWSRADEQVLKPLVREITPTPGSLDPGIWQALMDRAHLGYETNRDASTLAGFYSRALVYWGAELQRSGRLTNAETQFSRALDLNPDNLVASINLICNTNLQAGLIPTNRLSKSVEDEFGKYRSWQEISMENGPFDDPNFCYEQGRVFVQLGLYKQAIQQFERVQVLTPQNYIARLWLAQLYILTQLPQKAMKIVNTVKAELRQPGIVQTNRAALLSVELGALLDLKDVERANDAVQTAIKEDPASETVMATATQAYLNHRMFTNAIEILNLLLKITPDDPYALVNKGFCCLQIRDYAQAIPPLTHALELNANNVSALFNRAIAYLRSGQLDEAQKDYETLQKTYPNAPQIYYGLGDLSYRRKDTNAAIRNYQLYLANAATNTEEAAFVVGRITELKSGGP